MQYRVMIHPSGEVEQVLKPQLKTIATEVYGQDTDEVVFRVKKLSEHTNKRKLFFPGNGEIVYLKVFPHITLSQKIEIDEDREYILEDKMKKIASRKPFVMQSSYLGDYGEDFTVFLAFEDSKGADKLKNSITNEFGEHFSRDKEIRDILHATLVYDDASVDNFRKAWGFVDKNKLIGKLLPVNSVWLWKGLKPYKEFKFTPKKDNL